MFETNTVALPPEIIVFAPYWTMFVQSVHDEKSQLKEPLLNDRRELFVPEIVLNRASPAPLFQQIRQQIEPAIVANRIHEARLPSTRAMARLLRVSRNTVLAAYEELAADGLIRGERGAGMRVGNSTPAREMTAPGLKRAIRAARYPAKVLGLADPDGNPLYINY